jgi:hypothetical protein
MEINLNLIIIYSLNNKIHTVNDKIRAKNATKEISVRIHQATYNIYMSISVTCKTSDLAPYPLTY